MCMTCGCGRPLDGHGDERHIVLDQLVAAARAAGITVDQAAANIRDTLDAMVAKAESVEWRAHQGNAEALRRWYVHGEGAARIRWGEPGDFDRCVRIAGRFIRDPEGYCNERHHEALGIYPATHARLERDAEGKSMGSDDRPPFDHDVHPRHHETGRFVERRDVHQAMRRIHDGRAARRDTLPQPARPDHPKHQQ